MTEDIVKKENSQESAYSLMKNGKIKESVRKLETASSPAEMKRFFDAFNEDVLSNKDKALKIKDRSFFKALFSNNTKDIADVLYQQNILLAACFVLLRLNSSTGESCARMFADLVSKAKESSTVANEESSEIEDAILSIIERNAHEYHMDEVRDKAMMKLLKAASESHDFEARMTTALHEAEEEYKKASTKISQEHEQSITNIRQEYTQTIVGIRQEYETQLSSLKTDLARFKDRMELENSKLMQEVHSQKEYFISELARLGKLLADQKQDSLQKELLYRRRMKYTLFAVSSSIFVAWVISILAFVL